MISVEMFSAADLRVGLAARIRARRLDEAWTQEGLARRAGVTLASVKRFERTGLISLDGFLRIIVALGRVEEIAALLQAKEFNSIEDVLSADRTRRRVRGRVP